MKKRYFKPWIQKIIVLETAVLGLPLMMLEDFEVSLKTVLILIIWISIVVRNIYLLGKYGKFNFNKEEK